MPEGDSVRRTAHLLDQALAGQQLTGSDFRVPQLATTDLRGATVHGTATYGKHLLTRIDDLTLHTHLRMEGQWRSYPAGQRWDRPGSFARVVLRTARVDAVGFRLGTVELLPSRAEDTVIGHLGPDLLADTWDEAAAADRLLTDPHRTLGEALLDQTLVAGLGTIYVAEVCFAHGVHPLTPVEQVAHPGRLLTRARQMLQAGVRHGRPVTTGERRAPLWVYRRQRQPCRRCGTDVVAGQLGEGNRTRATYWCPHCQPGGNLSDR